MKHEPPIHAWRQMMSREDRHLKVQGTRHTVTVFLLWFPTHKTQRGFLVKQSPPSSCASKSQWLFLVPLKGGRWHIIPQKAIYKWYISGIYCQLGDYMPPTTFYGNQKKPLKKPNEHFLVSSLRRSLHLNVLYMSLIKDRRWKKNRSLGSSFGDGR